MNDMTEPRTALAILPRAALPTLIAADDKDILANLLKELEGWEPDISTPKGRNEVASKAQKVRVAKADFKRLGDRLKEDAIKTQRNVNAELKILEERMNALIAHVRAPLDEFEAQEKEKIRANEWAIAELEGRLLNIKGLESYQIAMMIETLPAFDFALEFKARGARVRDGVMAQLQMAHGAAVQREEEAAAEAQRQAEEAEQTRLAEIEARRVREEKIAQEAAERAKVEAEERAAHEAKVAEERAQAALAAAEAERVRQIEEGLKREREAAEALARAERQREEEARNAAERERVIIEREHLAAEQAENQRKHDAAMAEANRIAAIEAERSRVAEEAEAARLLNEKRAANQAHRKKINNEVLADLIEAINDNMGGELSVERTDDIAKAIIIAVASRKVRHTFIDYASTLGGPLL